MITRDASATWNGDLAGGNGTIRSRTRDHGLAEAGHEPRSIDVRTHVHLDPDALTITRIDLEAEGRVPGLDADGFREAAEDAKENCPVSKALDGVEIVLGDARLA